ncbi:hypothetical protein U91I_02386 [alpha proteobacterium U9-1i]|nr:hypothetical protein U91I_02386 [alpha proteobacterium U9-1i]
MTGIRAALLGALVATLTAFIPGIATAQYREGVPGVIPQAPEADPDAGANAILARFANWNRTAGRPKIMVFWNRVLTDETTTREIERVVETEDTRSGTSIVSETTSTQFGEASQSNEENIGQRRSERVTSAEAVTGGRYTEMDPAAERLLETTFANLFLQAGARVIDRDALLRRSSVGVSAADRSDLQFIESKALNEGVVYLIQVLPDPSTTSPTGMAFSVSIRHLPTSSLTAQFLTSGNPPPARARFVAGERGFERVTINRATPERVAAQVAIEAMERLAQR